MPRFRIRGLKRDHYTLDDDPRETLVDATDRDAASRKAGRMLFVKIDEVREVPDDEGRGLLWRLWRRLWG